MPERQQVDDTTSFRCHLLLLNGFLVCTTSSRLLAKQKTFPSNDKMHIVYYMFLRDQNMKVPNQHYVL